MNEDDINGRVVIIAYKMEPQGIVRIVEEGCRMTVARPRKDRVDRGAGIGYRSMVGGHRRGY